jgi:hypothetical protein
MGHFTSGGPVSNPVLIAFLMSLAFVAAVGASTPDPASRPSRESRLATMGTLAEPLIASYEDKLKATTEPASRELTQFVHYSLATGRDPAKAEYALRKCFDAQDVDPKSKKFGTVLWKQNHPEIDDPNAIEFTLHGIAPALIRYRDRLSPEIREYLKPHLIAGVAALQAHHVSVDYTNIFLMKATNLLLVGQYLSDPSIVGQGRQMLATWLQSVKEHGITEYDSPTYSSIVLNCLTPAHDLTADAEAKALLKTALDYVWSDVAANYFPGQQTLCGAQSRNYSFTSSVNILCNNYFLEGLRDTPGPIGLFNEGPDTYINALESRESGYHPAPEILALAQLPTRSIHQRVGSQPGMDRTTYITPDFSVGSSSHWYGEQDRLINIQLASSKVLPDIAVVADEFDSPYGRVKRPDRAGHQKPVELKRDVSIVQHDGTILALMNLVGAQNRELDNVATNVLLPVRADEILRNDSPIDTTHAFEIPVPDGSVVVLKQSRAAVAIRIIHADSLNEPAAPIFLKWDGNDAEVARLVAYHYAGQNRLIPAAPVRVAILIKASSCSLETDLVGLSESIHSAQISDRATGQTWSVSAQFLAENLLLSAGLDLHSGRPIARQVNGTDLANDEFTINGNDIAGRLLPHY